MIIDCQTIAAKRLGELRLKVHNLNSTPKLVAILVGDNPASEAYVQMKAKRSAEVGIGFEVVHFPADTDISAVVQSINSLNSDSTVSGILVQLPLPTAIDTQEVLDTIDPMKDVDGLTGKSHYLSATVKAILTIIEAVNVDEPGRLAEMMVTTIGQGRLVGRPLADYLQSKGVRVNRCDERTDKNDLKRHSRQADILVSATGVPGLITKDMVKPGALVIDCGAPKAEVDPAVGGVAGWLTPVPGGVGPLTIVSLLENTFEAATAIAS